MIDMMVEEVGVMKEVIMIDMKGPMICTTREEDIRIVVVEEATFQEVDIMDLCTMIDMPKEGEELMKVRTVLNLQ